jgi:hypothetical protein
MTSYAPNWTPRFKANYVVLGRPHSITLRVARGSSEAEITALGTVAHDVFNALAAYLGSDFSWTFASWAGTDSDIFTPVAVPASVAGAIDPADYTVATAIAPLTLSGRSATGRARVTLYGMAIGAGTDTGPGQDFKVLDTEIAALGDAIDVLQAGAIGNAGEVTVWYRQGTIKTNDRLVKKIRQGL